MEAKWVVVMMGLASLMGGCATWGAGADGGALGVTMAQGDGSPVRAGDASVVAARANPRVRPAIGPVRVSLDRGRFLVCFRRGDIETGYRLMAQLWTVSGSRLGEPVPISPPGADVYAAPELVAVEGGRAIATFPAFSEGRFELLSVPLEVREESRDALTRGHRESSSPDGSTSE
jgi:hypothetical protein